MSFSDLSIIGVDIDDIAWSFEPSGAKAGGKLTVEIPVRINARNLRWGFDVFLATPAGQEQYLRESRRTRKLTVTLEIRDRLSAAQRQAKHFPPDMPLRDDWPFSYRVDAFERREETADSKKKRAKAIAEGKTPPEPVFERPIYTVDLRVFALMGVWISGTYQLERGPVRQLDLVSQAAGVLVLDVRLDKLCRADLLPDPEQPVESRLLYPAHPVDLGHAPSGRITDPNLVPLGRFMVRHRPNRVDILWTATQSVLSLELTEPGDPSSGFVYWFNPQPVLEPDPESAERTRDWLNYDDLLHVHVSGKVKVGLSAPVNPPQGTLRGAYAMPRSSAYRIQDEAKLYGLLKGSEVPSIDPEEEVEQDNLYLGFFVDPFLWDGEPPDPEGSRSFAAAGWRKPKRMPAARASRLLRPISDCRFFRLKRHGGVASLPAFGAKASVGDDPGEDRAAEEILDYLRSPPEGVPLLVQLGTDVALGFLAPGVSDVMDYAEFNYALATGKDKWGNEVADWELVLMGLSVVPVFGTGATVLRRVAKVF